METQEIIKYQNLKCYVSKICAVTVSDLNIKRESTRIYGHANHETAAVIDTDVGGSLFSIKAVSLRFICI
jgi:hypothetical protein